MSVGRRVAAPKVRVRRSGLSQDPEKRARQLAGLKRGGPGRAKGAFAPLDKRVNENNVPGLVEFKRTPVYRKLVELARANTPEAMQTIIAIMRAPGIKARDRLYAADIIIQRGFGRAPLLVKVAGDRDDEANERPQLPPAMSRSRFALEVLQILREIGELDPTRFGGDDGSDAPIEVDATALDDSGQAVDGAPSEDDGGPG